MDADPKNLADLSRERAEIEVALWGDVDRPIRRALQERLAQIDSALVQPSPSNPSRSRQPTASGTSSTHTENSMEQDNEDITVVRIACRCIVLGVVTKYIDARCQKEIDEMAAAGAAIEHMSVRAFRDEEFGCACSPDQPNDQGTDDV